MNKAQLQKNVESRVRLRPQATEALGAHDDDWTVRKVTDETLELVNERTHHVATLVSTPSRPIRAIQGAMRRASSMDSSR
jgi:hypothetical protein